ncbi:hypothetical protein [Bacillus sp. AFS017336]|uniref:hypothetical protein n=1 Tax=Bacillus sp. AFS017336 TaxID=2033489 RepID=UPI000BF1BE75|nr:hypothetical protein [Bacillus sp. AFS017336]PEL13737.1 hypothetical protein CN601_03225 [Bacillus sp. AFS017336]
MKKISKVIILNLLIITLCYFELNAILTKHAVANYLFKEKGVNKNLIAEVKPFYKIFNGEKTCYVYVRAKKSKGSFIYFKAKGKVYFDSYTIGGAVYFGELVGGLLLNLK